jgi:spermidine synthase
VARQAQATRRERRRAEIRTRRGRERRDHERQRAYRSDREPWLVPVLAGAFLVSGAAGLVHEVVWTRLLGHLFGVSSYAIATVLAAYMGGLALGSAWLGGRVDRIRDPRRLYGWLELGVGLYALAVPFLLDLVEPVYGWLWRELRLSFSVFSVLRLMVAGAILLVPTMLLGATLPALAESLARRDGRRLGAEWLYTVNLAGAVLGVALAGFVLMPLLGVWGTVLAGAAINVAVAALVLALPRAPATETALPGDTASVEHGVGGGSPAAATPAAEAAAIASSPDVRTIGRDLLACAFVSGVLSLATQVAWNRVLVLIVGSTNYAFSSVLLVYLVSLGLGSALASRLGDRAARRGDVAAWARPALATGFLACAGLSAVAVALAGRLPELYQSLYSVSDARSLFGLVVRGVVSTGAIVFPPVLAAGTILPLALIAAGSGRRRGTGAVVGRVYAVNTLGSIVGAILGGFVLVPVIGARATLLALAALAAATGLGLMLRSADRPPWSAGIAVGASAAVLLAAFVLPAWNQTLFHLGIFEAGGYAGDVSRLEVSDAGQRVLFHREGRSASVLVTEYLDDGTRSMRIDARTNASDARGDMPTQILLAQLPILVAPHPEDVFIVGWGSGVTVGAALQAPLRSVTAVELESAVVEASALFRHVNHEPLSDPRVELLEDDARHVLLASDATYDVIISEPPHPFVVGVANLFTQDFYRLAERRLRPDGIIAQWVQTYELSLDTYRSVVATFLSVFPYAIAFVPGTGGDTILVGARSPLVLDLELLQERWRRPETRAELARAGLARPEHLLATAVLGNQALRSFAEGAPINTDDNMHVEFEAAAGSLVAHRLRPEIEARASGLDELVDDPRAVLESPERREAYVEGLTRLGRDPGRPLGIGDRP